MAARLLQKIATTPVALLISFSAFAQSPATSIDLNARLQEVKADAKQHQSLLKVGQKVAAVCANCHGEGGNSNKPEVPNLAGQNPEYLLDQVHQFSTGQRKNAFMEGILRALRPDEKVGVALFYAEQEVKTRPSASPELAAKGQQHYAESCATCHGPDGRGSEKMARIAGQHRHYLRVSLQRYRDGSGIRTDPMMSTLTRKMSDAEINAVATYIESMK